MDLFFAYLIVATRVPIDDENLFVPSAACEGRPIKRYEGREISPPPPAMESIKPARKVKGHMIKRVCKVCMAAPVL
jgi:hypothetical protein